MQFFEIAFLLLMAIALVRLIAGPVHPWLNYSNLAIDGVVLFLIGLIFEGIRWQMFPAYLAFALLMLAAWKGRETPRKWRMVGTVPLLALLILSGLLIHQLPVFKLPVPEGPYSVGTFEYSITDQSRVERYAPERYRELYLEVWYPADRNIVNEYPVSTLFQELYQGDNNYLSYLVSYLKKIPTHSHINAPIATPQGDAFPVLLYSHGGSSISSQNQQLMEHLASHGYVILSIGHPYDSIKVNLGNAGTIRMANVPPQDITLPVEEMERGLLSKITAEAGLSTAESSAIRGTLLALADAYAAAANEVEQKAVVSQALDGQLRPYNHLMSEETLGEYLTYIVVYQHSLVDYRVKDMQFVANNVTSIEAPVAGFHDVLDLSGFGIFGMSFGGAAAGEFCKIDNLCLAGTNLDGTQFGGHWNMPVAAPFLMFYHEAHQGGNDFAYLPPAQPFWDYAIAGTMHFDFIDVALFPLLRTLGMTGPIDKNRMIDIVNEVQLNFFDHYLKDKPISGELYADIPEIIIRRH